MEFNIIETTTLLNELNALMNIHVQERASNSRPAVNVEYRSALNQNSVADHASSIARRNRLSLSRRIQTVSNF